MRFTAVLGALFLTAVVSVPPAIAASATAPATMPAAPPMLAHKALYTLTLDNAKGNDVIAARGTMGYEVTDACDGWAVRQRLRMTITNTDGQDIEPRTTPPGNPRTGSGSAIICGKPPTPPSPARPTARRCCRNRAGRERLGIPRPATVPARCPPAPYFR